MAKAAKLAAYDLSNLHEPLAGVTGPREPVFSERVTVDGGVTWKSLDPKPREALVPYPMRLRPGQIVLLDRLKERGAVPAEFIREALDAALRQVFPAAADEEHNRQ